MGVVEEVVVVVRFEAPMAQFVCGSDLRVCVETGESKWG